MLRHIVMVTFKDRSTAEEDALHFRSMLLKLRETIPELKKMEVGLNINTKPSAHDLVLISDFEDEDGLNNYRVHPDHLKALTFMKEKVEKTAVVDYFL
jgi:hypothetical protein